MSWDRSKNIKDMNSKKVFSIYEKALRFANFAMFTIDLQLNRLKEEELMDGIFLKRRWADFHFFILAVTKLRQSAELCCKIDTIKEAIKEGLSKFDKELPFIRRLRNVDQHWNNYALNEGWDKSVEITMLEVGIEIDGKFEWLGETICPDECMNVCNSLFIKLIEAGEKLKGNNTGSL